MEQPSALDWEALKPEIRQLYLIENKTLSQVVATLKATHNIPLLTKNQLEFKLKQWHFRKSLPPKVWQFIAYKINKRKREGRSESQVLCGDFPVPEKKVKKALSRYAQPSGAWDFSKLSPKLLDDIQVSVQTPASASQPRSWPGHMPWLSFVDAFDYLLEKSSTIQLDSLALQSINSSERTDIMRANGLWGGMSRLSTALRELMPHTNHDGHDQASTTLQHQRGSLETSKDILELLLFLLSNNTPGVVYWSQRLDHFTIAVLRQASMLQSSLRDMIGSRQPSALALRDQLWAAALRVSDTAAVRELLAAGADPNKPITLKYLASRPIPVFVSFPGCSAGSTTALPLQMAIYARDRELADLLITHGASWTVAMARTSLLEFASFKPRPGSRDTSTFLDAILQHREDSIKSEDWIEATRIFTRSGDADSVKVLFKFYQTNMLSDLHLRTEALIYAIRNHLDDMVHVILEVGVDINAVTEVKKYPLWEAVYVGRADLCILLFQHGATAQLDRYDVPFPLQCAAYHGNTQLIDLLLENGADLEHIINLSENCKVNSSWCVDEMQLGRTVVEAALHGCQPEIALMLLELGANFSSTALAIAIRKKLPTMIENLLDAGQFSSSEGDQESALEAAIATHQVEIAHVILAMRPELYESSALCAATHMAIMTDDTLLVQILLERRTLLQLESEPDPDPDPLEGTALAIAAFFGNISLMNLLISQGIKPAICVFPEIMQLASPESIHYCPCEKHGESPIDGWSAESGWWRSSPTADVYTTLVSPLDAAVVGRSTAALTLLLREGYAADHHSLTAAARVGYFEGLEILLSSNTENNRDKDDLQPAMYAAVRGYHVRTVQRLLEAGVDVNGEFCGFDDDCTSSVYFQGSPHAYQTRTVLQAAVGARSPELVDLLLSHGADVHAPASEPDGATALQLAAMQGLLGIARKLLDAGASCNEVAPRPQGRTALEGAAEQGRLDMVQLLISHGVETTGDSRSLFISALKLANSNAHHAVADLLRSIRLWENEDERLFREETGPGIVDHNLHFQEKIEGKGKEREKLGEPQFTEPEDLLQCSNGFNTWLGVDMMDPQFVLPELMADGSMEPEDNGSSSSRSVSVRQGLRAMSGGPQAMGSSTIGLRAPVGFGEMDSKDDWINEALFEDFVQFQDASFF